jgi:hypothetical protein
MPLTDRQLTTYLLEVREVVELMLVRFSEIATISGHWVRAKSSEEQQLADWEAGVTFDDDTWREVMSTRARSQAEYFLALEGYLAAWARLSLLLFPLAGKGKLAQFRDERGQRLRTELGISSTSILVDRELRDSWMHFDERLDAAILDGTFRERHYFVRATEAAPLVPGAIALLEMDTLHVHYRTRDGVSDALDLRDLDGAVRQVREALRRTIAG